LENYNYNKNKSKAQNNSLKHKFKLIIEIVVSSYCFQQEEVDELDVEIITNHASHVALNM
jgi:hypothetical protein